MKEKITKVQRIEEVITYISDDGQEFKNADECRKWEQKEIKDKTKKLLYQIPHVKTDGYDSYIRCGTEDDEVLILKIRSIEDINTINAYSELCKSSVKLDNNAVGKLVVLALDYDDYVWYANTVEEYLSDINKAYKQFEEKLNSL